MKRFSVLLALAKTNTALALDDTMRKAADLKVIGRARNLMETFACVEEHNPDLVIIDQAMTRVDEFEVMRALFATLDVRWLILGEGSATGAAKSGLFPIDHNGPPQLLLDQIRAVTRVARLGKKAPCRGQAPRQSYDNSLVLIGSSTGGVDALVRVLSHFASDCPPTMIVQHTGQGFGHSLIRLLQRHTTAQVVRPTEGQTVSKGMIYVGAGLDHHLVINGQQPALVHLKSGGPVSGHIPSVDALFRSALPVAGRCVVALLTGMGRDGAYGLLDLRKAGAHTIGQDQATSVVYGMPRVAAEIGALSQQLPIDAIGPAILKAAKRRASTEMPAR